MAGQENQQYTVLYGRLSQEDERAGESNSIQHQRTLLEKYAKEKGFENTIFLADDGYSGTNFERQLRMGLKSLLLSTVESTPSLTAMKRTFFWGKYISM